MHPRRRSMDMQKAYVRAQGAAVRADAVAQMAADRVAEKASVPPGGLGCLRAIPVVLYCAALGPARLHSLPLS